MNGQEYLLINGNSQCGVACVFQNAIHICQRNNVNEVYTDVL